MVTPRQELPVLPLLMWKTPPALEQMLAQEGIPVRKVEIDDRSSLDAGKFVLFDSRSTSPHKVRSSLSPQHLAIDVGLLRSSSADPFAEYTSTEAAVKVWVIAGYPVKERVSRVDRGLVRKRVIDWLRAELERSGGTWARLSPYPQPYRSAFNFRADLDESYPDDYFAFARARQPLDDCSTHFVSTAAYADCPEVLDDLKRVDTQSHGHFHVVYRSESANRRNLSRADEILQSHGFAVQGFAAPEGRWNPGLDQVLEELGYQYSSDFSLGYDDLPFYPWRGDRVPDVLQIPVHPICEGLFLDAGCTDPSVIADHLIATLNAKVARGEPAFVYGHPERRLGRFPDAVAALASAVGQLDSVWRVTLTEFARWWKWRERRTWSLFSKGPGLFEVQFEDWDEAFPLALEIARTDQVAFVNLASPRQTIALPSLDFAKRPTPAVLPDPRIARAAPSWRSMVKAAIDWETVTPWDEIPSDGLRNRLKKRLRTIRSSRQMVVGRSVR